MTTTTTNDKPTTWTEVYHDFMALAMEILDQAEDHIMAHLLIAEKIDDLYCMHIGDPAWDLAYKRWYEYN